jgi:nucleotide-binding universal stress UspA family protein
MKAAKIKKVLIALDYDPTAQKVAEAGYSLAKSLKAEAILINVISDPASYYSAKPFTVMGFAGQFETEVPQVLNVRKLKEVSRQYLANSKLHLGDTTIQTIIAEGDTAESIMLTVKKIKADIVVLGSHSRRKLENIVMGSVTEKVIRSVTIPLVIIPTSKA